MKPNTSAADLQSFHNLNPDTILTAVESTGHRCSGRLFAMASYENRVYQLGLEDASSIVAKFYRPGRWDDATIREEHAFSLELAGAEIPAVSPLCDDTGASLHHFGNHRFALYPSIGGRAPSLDDRHSLEQLGRLLGRTHAVGAVRRFEHRPSIDPERLGAHAAASILESGTLPGDLIEPYRMLSSRVLDQVRAHFEAVGEIRTLRLHGDCHGGNILVKDDVAQLLDFDDACTGPSIQDLWMLLSGEREYMQARLVDVLSGYSEFADFDARELALIEPLRALRMLHYAAWLNGRRADPAFTRAFPWFYERNFWDQHILSLHEQLAAMQEPPLAWI